MKHLLNLSRREKQKLSGFTLIELMISLGILGVVMTGFASYVTSASRAQKAISVKVDQQDFKGLISSPSSGVSINSKCGVDLNIDQFPAANTWAATPRVKLDKNTVKINEYNSDGVLIGEIANPNTGVIKSSSQIKLNDIFIDDLNRLSATVPTAIPMPITLELNVQASDETLASMRTLKYNMNVTTQQPGGPGTPVTIKDCQVTSVAGANVGNQNLGACVPGSTGAVSYDCVRCTVAGGVLDETVTPNTCTKIYGSATGTAWELAAATGWGRELYGGEAPTIWGGNGLTNAQKFCEVQKQHLAYIRHTIERHGTNCGQSYGVVFWHELNAGRGGRRPLPPAQQSFIQADVLGCGPAYDFINSVKCKIF